MKNYKKKIIENSCCSWVNSSKLCKEYHDKEWGVPTHNDKILFEILILEGAQAGLSWQTILKKRENYREAFDNFNPNIIANYDENKILNLLSNKGIIRNEKKIRSAVKKMLNLFYLLKREAVRFQIIFGLSPLEKL